MKLPPAFVLFRLKPPSLRFIPALWIPICLLWPIALLIFLPLFIAGIVIAAIAGMAPRFLQIVGAVYRLLCEFKGTLIDVQGDGARITIAFH